MLIRDKLTAVLRQHPEGLTPAQMSEKTGVKKENVYKTLPIMPDVYIDRWEGPFRGQYRAVWCAVIPPDHCPHPRGDMVAVRPGRRTAATKTAQAVRKEFTGRP